MRDPALKRWAIIVGESCCEVSVARQSYLRIRGRRQRGVATEFPFNASTFQPFNHLYPSRLDPMAEL